MKCDYTKEIGSEYYLEEEYLSSKCLNDSFTEHGNNTAFLRSGREAIGFVLDNIKKSSGIALLPAYCCESMVEPFILRGYDVEYYCVGEDLKPDNEDIKKLIYLHPDIVLCMDWFGLDVSYDIKKLIRSLSEKAIILEDCTHTYFSEENNNQGIMPDYKVASLRKWFGTPDGAVSISNYNKFTNIPEPVDNEFSSLRRKALLVKGIYIKNKLKEIKDQYKDLFTRAEKSLGTEDSIIGMSDESKMLFKHLNRNELIKKRRENFMVLDDNLRKTDIVKPISDSLADKTCPFSYPVLINKNRDHVQRRLAEEGVYCPVLWPLTEKAYKRCPESAKISANMLSIPCDQRYDPDDMLYIVQALRKIITA